MWSRKNLQEKKLNSIKKEIDDKSDVIKEKNLQEKKLDSIEKEIDDESNVIKRRFLRKIFKKRS